MRLQAREHGTQPHDPLPMPDNNENPSHLTAQLLNHISTTWKLHAGHHVDLDSGPHFWQWTLSNFYTTWIGRTGEGMWNCTPRSTAERQSNISKATWWLHERRDSSPTLPGLKTQPVGIFTKEWTQIWGLGTCPGGRLPPLHCVCRTQHMAPLLPRSLWRI